MTSAKVVEKLAQCNLQNYFEGRIELETEDLLELIQSAFPARSLIDQLAMVFEAQKLNKNKKMGWQVRYEKLAGIGNPVATGASYGTLPEVSSKKKGKK